MFDRQVSRSPSSENSVASFLSFYESFHLTWPLRSCHQGVILQVTTLKYQDKEL